MWSELKAGLCFLPLQDHAAGERGMPGLLSLVEHSSPAGDAALLPGMPGPHARTRNGQGRSLRVSSSHGVLGVLGRWLGMGVNHPQPAPCTPLNGKACPHQILCGKASRTDHYPHTPSPGTLPPGRVPGHPIHCRHSPTPRHPSCTPNQHPSHLCPTSSKLLYPKFCLHGTLACL